MSSELPRKPPAGKRPTTAAGTALQLPPHIEQTVRAIAKLHADHQQRATFPERLVESATSVLGRPAFVVFVLLAVGIWIGGNLVLLQTAHFAFDKPPFAWLQGVLTAMALVMAALILTTQRRADQLTGLREQMTLELAILTEQKAAKLIELIEELRTDSPQIKDRVDHEASEMASRADPHEVLDAIEEKNHKPSASADNSGAKP